MKRYLGDGVYVDIQNDMLKLTTEDGLHVLNTIYLEPQVYEALVRYAEREYPRHSIRTLAASKAGAGTEVDQHRGIQDQGDVHPAGV